MSSSKNHSANCTCKDKEAADQGIARTHFFFLLSHLSSYRSLISHLLHYKYIQIARILSIFCSLTKIIYIKCSHQSGSRFVFKDAETYSCSCSLFSTWYPEPLFQHSFYYYLIIIFGFVYFCK